MRRAFGKKQRRRGLCRRAIVQTKGFRRLLIAERQLEMRTLGFYRGSTSCGSAFGPRAHSIIEFSRIHSCGPDWLTFALDTSVRLTGAKILHHFEDVRVAFGPVAVIANADSCLTRSLKGSNLRLSRDHSILRRGARCPRYYHGGASIPECRRRRMSQAVVMERSLALLRRLP